MWPPKSERSWLSFSGPAAAVSLRAALSEAVQAAWGPAGGGCCLDDHPAVKYLARHGGVLPPKPVTLRARRSRTMRGITSSRRNRRFQQGEDLVLRASDDLGNILLSDALGIEWYLAILVAADRQASLDAGHPNRVPLDAGPASNVHLDIGCRIAGDLHFRDQAGNGKHQILIQVTSKDSAATVSNSSMDGSRSCRTMAR